MVRPFYPVRDWSSDDRWLVYGVSPSPRRLMTVAIPPDGSDRHELVHWNALGELAEPEGTIFDYPFWSLDWGPGDRFAVYTDRLPQPCRPA